MISLKLLFIVSLAVAQGLEPPIVLTPLGQVRGFTETSYGGRVFSAFEGIPFAKPPIESLRFEPPQPVEPWSGVWDARFPTICSQKSFITANQIIGDEDCLHINVYVPRENPQSTENLDVVVHIHGGAYIAGHGKLYSGPSYAMDREVVFVTFNYRLGILGFLSTEDDVVSGNNGLKDQAVALQWIQDNIQSFGGNPDSVTITGLSAGGSSVHFHYFSEWSRGLFHRGVSQSGVALNCWSIQENPLEKAKLLAAAVGCITEDNRQMVDCLKQRPHRQLLEQLDLFHGYKVLPVAPFAPVVEKGKNPFISNYPYNLLKEKKVLDLPWIASHAAYEGLVFTHILQEDLEDINSKWTELAPILLDFNYTLPKSLWQFASNKIKSFYFGEDGNIDIESYYKFVQVFSDRGFIVDAETAVLMQAKATKSPVYYQWFSYPGDNTDVKEVAHGFDAKFYFDSEIGDNKPLTKNELKMKDIVWDFLTTYAKTGVPRSEGVEWKPTGSSSLTYLNVSGINPDDIRLQTTESLAPGDFWKSLGLLENENLSPLKDEL